VFKPLQGNIPNKALTDVNGKRIVFRASDESDQGLNGTEGITYSLTGDGKFQPEKVFWCALAS
jgi:hypothetical protein